jgi:hypothetical protein
MSLASWSVLMSTSTTLMTTTMMMMMMTMILWLADEILGSPRHQSDIHACAGNTACSFLPLVLQTSQNPKTLSYHLLPFSCMYVCMY